MDRTQKLKSLWFLRALLVISMVVWGFLTATIADADDSQILETQIDEPAIDLSNRLIEQQALFGEQLRALESEFGPYHLALIKPLQELTYLQVDLKNYQQQIELDDGSSGIYKITDFVALNESLPVTRRPIPPELLFSTSMNSVLLLLAIGSDGYVDTATILGASPDEPRVRAHVMDAVGGLTFRTIPVNRWWSAKQTVTLLYQYPEKIDDLGY